MVSSDSSTSIRSLLHPTDTGAVLIQPDNHPSSEQLHATKFMMPQADRTVQPIDALRIKMDGTDDSTVTYYGANVKNGKGKRSCMIT